MRAPQVIATHGNTDFDAFGAMLAARLLYPDAVVAIATLSPNVRDFYRRHANELGAIAEVSRLELDAIRQLIVVEVTSASLLGELEAVALDPDVETALFGHHAEHELPEWVSEATAVQSTDGALTTTLVGILAQRDLAPSVLEATAFALGIHEDTGSLTYATTTQRDIDALSWCFRRGARQDLVNAYLLAPTERRLLPHPLDALEPIEPPDDHVLLAAVSWPEPLARDVMSTPARAVEPTASVRDAMTLCQRHGQSGVFVAEEGRLVGGVSREDLDKAIGHELAHAPVRGIMSSRVVSAHEDASLTELRTLVTAAEDGRVAVLRADELVGVVSRADLLRALESVPAQPSGAVDSIGEQLRSSSRLTRIAEAITQLGERTDGVYLVGGTIRDLLLGEGSFDVDIAVEGDAIAFAYALAGALGGRATPHQRFGTSIVSYGDGERIDVVTTRTEFYDAPGALPMVERAGLREDLFRRDFTINAMAASLAADDRGRLVDPYGGRADLDARVLRVLHNLSFIDDPTRIFRGVRYETRHGFRFEDHTARLLRGCIEMGLVGDLSSSRLRDELVALLEEPGAAAGIRRLGELGADRAIHPHLRGDDAAAALFARASDLRDELAVDVPRWHIGLAALACEMPPDEAYDWLDRLTLRRRDAERIVGAVTVAPRIVERMRSERLDAAQVVALADPFAPDAPLLALAIEDRPELREYFDRLCSVRLEIGGADLIALGLPESPQVGEILGELRRRKLNGELDGREAELAAARELVAASVPA